MANFLILLGVVFLLGGILIKAGVPLGNLPGDIRVNGQNFALYLPITTSILVSIILSLLFRLLN